MMVTEENPAVQKKLEELIDANRPRTWQETLRLIVPHAGLLLITVLYAFAGAVVFYLVEHPNEILVRQYALDEIRTARKTIEEQLQLSTKLRLPEHLWKEELSTKIHKLTEVLHASSKNYVNPQNLRQSFIEPDKKPEKIWTISSALSFAFTTMATIGYGNVTPLTPEGRMICVIFGLIGTPLAIIAIADMGKFFSECLISFYMKLSSMHLSPKCLLKKLGGKLHWFRKTLIKTNAENDEYEELCRAKVHVPVILVLAAFFLYMLLGTVLFAYMENWAWMDSFYFCFITLTTIGFGDLVPNAQNKDLAVMLVYILLGLALTTMCIDLVAIRYIERIHQYGQSVKGPDLKKLLNRRRKRVRNLHISVTDLSPTQQIACQPESEEPFSPPVPPWPVRYNIENTDEIEGSDEESTLVSAAEINEQNRFTDIDAFEKESLYIEQECFPICINQNVRHSRGFIQPIFSEALDTLKTETYETSQRLCRSLIIHSSFQAKCQIFSEISFQCQYEQVIIEALERVSVSVSRNSMLKSSIHTNTVVSDMVYQKGYWEFSFPLPDPGENNCNSLYPGYEFPDDLYDRFKNEIENKFGNLTNSMNVSGRSNLDLSGLKFEDLPTRHRDSIASQLSDDSAVSTSTERSRSDYLWEDESDNMNKLSEMLTDIRWKQMGHPIVYYYSDDLRTFYKVQVTSSKGKIIRAQFLKQRKKGGRHQQQRRNSGAMEFRHDRPIELTDTSGDIPLSKIYKVTTFYSSWKNFSKFHRTITHVQAAVQAESAEGLKEKFFTQYKFINASEEDQKAIEAQFKFQSHS